MKPVLLFLGKSEVVFFPAFSNTGVVPSLQELYSVQEIIGVALGMWTCSTICF